MQQANEKAGVDVSLFRVDFEYIQIQPTMAVAGLLAGRPVIYAPIITT